MKYLFSFITIFGCSQTSPSGPATGFEGLPSFFNLDYAQEHQCITHTFQDGLCVVTKVICEKSEYSIGARCKTAPRKPVSLIFNREGEVRTTEKAFESEEQ